MPAVKADQVARFPGKKITALLARKIGSRFTTRSEGLRSKLRFGKAGVTLYDKFGCVLRLETTISDVSFSKRHHKAEHRDRIGNSKRFQIKSTST